MRSLLLVIAVSTTLSAADWPQFLGPKWDNSSGESIQPWTAAPRELWKMPVGAAHSSPVVAGGKVYAFYQDKSDSKENDVETLAAFDAKTGALIWKESYERPSFTPPFGKGPRSTPTVAGKQVFTFGNTGILTARDAVTGQKQWQHDVLTEFKAKNLFFGTSTSPIAVDGKVIVLAGGTGAGLVAFDAQSGEKAWAITDDPASYATPTVYRHNNETTIAVLTGTHLRGVTSGGELRWAYPFQDKINESSTTPVVVGNQLLGSSVTIGSVLLNIDGAKAEKAWAKKNLTCYFSTPVVVDKHIYMVNGAATLLNPAVTLRCVDLATGAIAWEREKVGRYHAAIVKMNDSKLLMLDDNGYLSLFEANPKEFKELAKSKVCGTTWASPAVVDGVIYLRDERELKALQMP